jgi:hypothetical protein
MVRKTELRAEAESWRQGSRNVGRMRESVYNYGGSFASKLFGADVISLPRTRMSNDRALERAGGLDAKFVNREREADK